MTRPIAIIDVTVSRQHVAAVNHFVGIYCIFLLILNTVFTIFIIRICAMVLLVNMSFVFLSMLIFKLQLLYVGEAAF